MRSRQRRAISETARLELPDLLASASHVLGESRRRQRVEVLGDRLTGDPGTFAQPRDGQRPFGPPSFMRNASARRASGMLSNPDSHDRQARAAGDVLQRELDERHGLGA